MKRIMMISGPALGHVARLSLVAEALNNHTDIRIDFVVPQFSTHHHLAKAAGCHVHQVDIADIDRKFPALPFAEQVEGLFEDLKPDVIVQDCNPLRWMPAIRYPDCPRIIITNAFLMKLSGFETHQSAELEKKRDVFDRLRQERDLPKLKSAFDLYHATLTVLADPDPIVAHFGHLPDDVINAGPLCLDGGGALPEALSELHDAALFSMGSTGGLDAYIPIADEMRKSEQIGPTVYVGTRHKEARETGAFDVCFDWLPLSSVLDRSRVVITHGGTGSTYLALSKGVPVFISPKHANHALLARSLEALGVGALLEDVSDINRIEDMCVKLDQYGAAFDHHAAPQKHADAILGLL